MGHSRELIPTPHSLFGNKKLGGVPHMKHTNEKVNIAIGMVLFDNHSRREVARLLHIGRAAVGRWVRRVLAGEPTHKPRAPTRVWNRTVEEILGQIRQQLEAGVSAVKAWFEISRKTCLRTIQRWQAKWFPVVREKIEVKRYERRNAFSLMHTDWGTKRINEGKRCCFTFYVDDATRWLTATRAYPSANLENTIDAFCNARSEAAFNAVLSDRGKVYMNCFRGMCLSNRVRSIHTRPYNPKCNGKAEAVVKKIKAFLSKQEVRSIEHANELLQIFEYEYNRTPHSSLKYKTPLEILQAKQASGLICDVA